MSEWATRHGKCWGCGEDAALTAVRPYGWNGEPQWYCFACEAKSGGTPVRRELVEQATAVPGEVRRRPWPFRRRQRGVETRG